MFDSPEVRAEDESEAPKRSRVGQFLLVVILLTIVYVASEPWVFVVVRKWSPDPPPVWLDWSLDAYSYPAEVLAETSTAFADFHSWYFVLVFEIVY